MIQNEINEEINILAATKAKKNGLKVCLNPSPLRNLSSDLIKNIDILIVNKIEAEAISKEKISNFDAAKKISSKLNEKYPLVIITLGENGVVFSELNKKPTHLTTKKINVNNTHGAGDVFAGIFCASYALNDDLLTALQLANEKATFHVAK